MVDATTVTDILFAVIDDTNFGLSPAATLEKSLDTPLFGRGASLDSMGLVSFLVVTEQKLEEALNVSVILADESAMSQERSPFRTIGSLVDYIVRLLNESRPT